MADEIETFAFRELPIMKSTTGRDNVEFDQGQELVHPTPVTQYMNFPLAMRQDDSPTETVIGVNDGAVHVPLLSRQFVAENA